MGIVAIGCCIGKDVAAFLRDRFFSSRKGFISSLYLAIFVSYRSVRLCDDTREASAIRPTTSWRRQNSWLSKFSFRNIPRLVRANSKNADMGFLGGLENSTPPSDRSVMLLRVSIAPSKAIISDLYRSLSWRAASLHTWSWFGVNLLHSSATIFAKSAVWRRKDSELRCNESMSFLYSPVSHCPAFLAVLESASAGEKCRGYMPFGTVWEQLARQVYLLEAQAPLDNVSHLS